MTAANKGRCRKKLFVRSTRITMSIPKWWPLCGGRNHYRIRRASPVRRLGLKKTERAFTKLCWTEHWNYTVYTYLFSIVLKHSIFDDANTSVTPVCMVCVYSPSSFFFLIFFCLVCYAPNNHGNRMDCVPCAGARRSLALCYIVIVRTTTWYLWLGMRYIKKIYKCYG